MTKLRNFYLGIAILFLFVLGQTVDAGVLYFPSQGFTGGTVGGATTFTSLVTFTTGGNFADGTATVPSIAWTSDADGTGTGFYRRAANEFSFTTNGVGAIRFGAGTDLGGIGISGSSAGNGYLGWAAGIGAASDLILNREGAAILQMGVDVNGAAITQTVKAADGITGTDIIGSGLTLAPGKGTGAGVSQPLTVNRNLVAATGTTAQTQAAAFVVCPTKILSTATGTAQTIATITTTSTTAGAVQMFYTVTASNGTLLDADSGEVQTAWNNNAGTVAATMAAAIGGANSVASGTLAATPTATVATNVISIKFTPAWTVIVPNLVTGYATFYVNGVNTVACQ